MRTVCTEGELSRYYGRLRFDAGRQRRLGLLHRPLQALSALVREYPYALSGAAHLSGLDRPAIYAVSHSEYGPENIQLVNEILPRPCITLANWNIRGMKPYVRAFFALSGVIYVRRDMARSRALAKAKCLEALRAGLDVAIYPEATWNFDEARLVLPFRHGIVKIAAATGAPIVPVSLSQLGGRYDVAVGAPLRFSFTDASSAERETPEIFAAGDALRDALATLKWGVLEAYARENTENGVFMRASLPPDDFMQRVVAHTVAGHRKHGMRVDVDAERALVYRGQGPAAATK